MKPGDVLLTVLPQFDGQMKSRPTLILALVPPFNDPLVCGISTQLQQEVKGFDDLIVPDEQDFGASGLKAPSVIRLGYMSVVMPRQFKGVLGAVSGSRLKRLLERVSARFAEMAGAVS